MPWVTPSRSASRACGTCSPAPTPRNGWRWPGWLNAIIEGSAPDELGALRRVLLEQDEPIYGTVPMDAADELVDAWRTGVYPYRNLMSRKEYERQKYHLQVELLKLQAWVKETGQRIVILFEGRDAAGKGGTIKRFMEHLNPRGARVVALEKPTEIERGQWYFQRYVQHLPTRGEIVLFDRSWYNRAGVERVMGFATDDEVAEFLRQVPEFERNLARSGVHLIKFWFSVSQDEQRRRFLERERHPLKQWKLSPVDLASLDLWDDVHRGQERHVPGHGHRRGPLDRDQVQRQEAGPAQRHPLRAPQDALHGQGRLGDPPPRPPPGRAGQRRVRNRGVRRKPGLTAFAA